MFKPEDLGEVLEGDRLVTTQYDIRFRVDNPDGKLCQKVLTVEDVRNFRRAVHEDYYYQVGKPK